MPEIFARQDALLQGNFFGEAESILVGARPDGRSRQGISGRSDRGGVWVPYRLRPGFQALSPG